MSSVEYRASWVPALKWVARIWSLPAIFFAVSEILFSSNTRSVAEGWFTWATVIMMFLSVVGLLVAWWNERFGGWASIGTLVVFFIFYYVDAAEFFRGWVLLLSFVAIPAVIFLIFDYFQQREF